MKTTDQNKDRSRILVIGAAGQIGVELTLALRLKHGNQNVIASDVASEPKLLRETGPWVEIDVMSEVELYSTITRANVGEVYLLAAMLSATGEQDPQRAWNLNMKSLINVLNIAKEERLKVFWPSSIAAVAPASTVYGISKAAGEFWCRYYHDKYGVDVRSLRYPGLISYKSKPGGGTTDYAVDIFHSAIAGKNYECFLQENTRLPMMYMDDAVRATLQLMDAPAEKIRNRMSYSIAGMSFTPKEIFQSIKAFSPDFTITYKPDRRQQIADSWPQMIDDTEARNDWNWSPAWNLTMMTNDMLVNLEKNQIKSTASRLEEMGVI